MTSGYFQSVFHCFIDVFSPACNYMQLPDDKSTVDPSFTISLIRKLVPQGPDVDKELRCNLLPEILFSVRVL